MKESLMPAIRKIVSKLPANVVAELTAAGLNTYEGKGRVPYPVFIALGGVVVSSTLEVVPLRKSPINGNIEALLAQRPDSDEFWPAQWHVTGSSLLVTDGVEQDEDIDFDREDFDPIASYLNPAERLISNEFAGTVAVSGLFLVEARFRRGLRSTESTVMLGGEVMPLQEHNIPGQFFEVNTLTANPPAGGFIVGHPGLIRRAADMYAARQAA
jgi:hypothetical protein